MLFGLFGFVSFANLAFAESSLPEPYAPPFWLPGGHLQTIYAAEFAQSPDVSYIRQRIDTPDSDFIDLDWTALPNENTKKPIVVMFHGLEGNSSSHYAKALMATSKANGFIGVVIHFRGCSGEVNRKPRVYYAGDTAEIEFMLGSVHNLAPEAPIYAVGVSLGANALLKWLGESSTHANSLIKKAVAVSAPMDLAATANVLDHGLNRWLYTPRFVDSMRPKALTMLERFPELKDKLDPDKINSAKTIHDIDNAVTAVLYGAKDADDYYAKNASKPWLTGITVPTLIINALNDPFVPAETLPNAVEVSQSVTLEYPNAGGHVGFIAAGGHDWLPDRILEYFNE